MAVISDPDNGVFLALFGAGDWTWLSTALAHVRQIHVAIGSFGEAHLVEILVGLDYAVLSHLVDAEQAVVVVDPESEDERRGRRKRRIAVIVSHAGRNDAEHYTFGTKYRTATHPGIEPGRGLETCSRQHRGVPTIGINFDNFPGGVVQILGYRDQALIEGRCIGFDLKLGVAQRA